MKKQGIVVMVSMIVLVLAASTGVAAEKEIRIGYNAALSGPGAAWCMPEYHGIEMAIEEINAAGGLTIRGEKWKIKLFVEDSKYEVAASVAAMEKLVYRDKVHVMYTFGGAPVLATQEKLAKIPMISFINAFGKAYREPKLPYVYCSGMSSEDFNEEFLGWIPKNYKKYVDYPLEYCTYVGPKAQRGWVQEADTINVAKAVGLKTLESEYIDKDTRDLNPIAQRLIASKTNIIITPAVSAQITGLLLKARDELGGKFVVAHSAAMPEETQRIAPEASEKDFLFRFTDYNSAPKLKAFLERYKKRWNEMPFWITGMGYRFVGVYADAVQKAGGPTNIDAIKKVLDAPDYVYEGLAGPMKWGGKSIFGRNVDLYGPIGIGHIKGGKVEPLDMVDVKIK